MDKNQAKLLTMSLMAPFIILFSKNPKLAFIPMILNELIVNHFDEAWDLYVKQKGMTAAEITPAEVAEFTKAIIKLHEAVLAP